MSEDVSIAIGCFDGIHIAHQKVLDSTIEDGMKRAVLTFTYKNVEKISTEEVKSELIENLGIDILIDVEFTDKFKNLSCEDFFNTLINNFNVKKICVGYNFTFGKNGSGNVETLSELCCKNNINLCVTPKVTYNGLDVSSSQIRDLIDHNNYKLANELLGREDLKEDNSNE